MLQVHDGILYRVRAHESTLIGQSRVIMTAQGCNPRPDRQQTTYGDTRRAALTWAADIYPSAYCIQCRPLPPHNR